MIFFVTFLRALAACFITNAHYTGIYPTDLIANGGLVGDVLFFAVSGFCLYNVKFDLSVKGFARWYGKRIWRIYPPVVLITAIYMALGIYGVDEERGALWWYVYPTYYHFVASIMALYIPFFFIMKIERLRNNLPTIMGLVAVFWLVVYWTCYDRTYYHVDKVREPMIRFLFMDCLLLGAWFRQKDQKVRDVFKPIFPISAACVFILYFASKLLFSKREEFAQFQFLNWVPIFILLFLLFRTFSGLDDKLSSAPKPVKRVIQFLSDLTLEIYIVQFPIIDVVRSLDLPFPLNWTILTCGILIAAYTLHKVCAGFYWTVEKGAVNLLTKGRRLRRQDEVDG